MSHPLSLLNPRFKEEEGGEWNWQSLWPTFCYTVYTQNQGFQLSVTENNERSAKPVHYCACAALQVCINLSCQCLVLIFCLRILSWDLNTTKLIKINLLNSALCFSNFCAHLLVFQLCAKVLMFNVIMLISKKGRIYSVIVGLDMDKKAKRHQVW